MVDCSGLENPAGNPQKSAENAVNCGESDAREAMFTNGSATCDGTRTGTKNKPLRITRARLSAASMSEDEVPEDIFDFWMSLGSSGYTYFARGKYTGRIKIGRSRDPWGRVNNLAWVNNGEEAELLCTLRGVHFERRYHQQFHEHLDGCEWFAPHPSILAEIERLSTLTKEPTP